MSASQRVSRGFDRLPLFLAAITCVLAVFSTPVAGADDTMVFRTEPPDPRFVVATGTAWNIYAEGIIDKDAPQTGRGID